MSITAMQTIGGEIQSQVLNDNFSEIMNYFSAVFSAKDQGMTGDGVTDDYAAFDAILDSIGTNEREIYFPSGQYVVGTNITVPANVRLKFAKGAILDPSVGVTITVNGPVEAGLYKIFDANMTGKGTVSGAPKISYAYPQWFGAVGDGTTDDSDAFNAALDFFDVVSVPNRHGSGYRINAQIDITNNKHLVGHNFCILTTGANKLFNITGSYCHIEGFYINAVNTSSESHALFYFDTAAGHISHIEIRDVEIWDAYAAFRDANSTNNVTYCNLSNVSAFRPKNTVVKLYDFLGTVHFNKLTVDMTFNVAAPTFEAIRIESNVGMRLTECDVLGYGPGPGETGAHAFVFSGCSAIWIINTMADTVGDVGFYFISCDYVNVIQATSSLCGGHQFYFDACDHIQCTDLYALGRNQEAWKPASKHGVYVKDNAQPPQINGIKASYNTGNGLYVENSSSGLYAILETPYNTGTGIVEAGTSNYNLFSTATSFFNTSASGTLVGANSNIANWRPNSGTYIANTAGAGTV